MTTRRDNTSLLLEVSSGSTQAFQEIQKQLIKAVRSTTRSWRKDSGRTSGNRSVGSVAGKK